jgi:SAM-dependent methyltransferase
MADPIVQEFGDQWLRFGDTSGTFGSVDVLRDICGPLLDLDELRGRRVIEIGSGSGRIVNMLLDAGAARVIAVEPSDGIEVLKTNTRARADRVEYLRVMGDQIPDVQADVALCIGVLHHLPDPVPTVRRVHDALPPGARFLFWVYGREGNGAYIVFAESMRRLTSRMPDWMLSAVAHAMNAILTLYVALCRVLPLPLHRYMRNVLARFDRQKRFFLIFDQLNTRLARYYTGEQARELMAQGGFRNVRSYHRHGMSWTILGEKHADSRRQ